jgi:hypothetical protein
MHRRTAGGGSDARFNLYVAFESKDRDAAPPGGTINVRAGKGGPTGPGGPVKFKDSPVQVGK